MRGGLLACTLGIAVGVGVVPLCGWATAAQVTLRVGMAESKTPQAKLDAFAQPFEALHPDIKVEFVPNYGPNVAKLATEEAAGVAPDIIGGWNGLPEVAAQNGLLLDLMPYIQRDGMQSLLSDLVPSYVASMTIDGHLYALPQYSWVGGMFYDRSMFDEDGIAAPSGAWDWTTFSTYADKLTKRDADNKVTVTGATFPQKWLWEFPWLEMAGAKFTDPNHVDLGSDGAITAVTFLQNLEKQGRLKLAYSGPLKNGTAAMYDSGSYELPGLATTKGFNLSIGVAPLPVGPTGQRINMTNDDSYAINRATKYPDQAWTFLSWFYSKPVQEQYMQTFGLQPARLSLGLQWINAVNDLYHRYNVPLVTGLNTFITESAYAHAQPVFSDEKVVSQYIDPALRDTIVQGKPVAATLKEASDAANAALQQANAAH